MKVKMKVYSWISKGTKINNNKHINLIVLISVSGWYQFLIYFTIHRNTDSITKMALINLQNFSNGMISGVIDEELGFFNAESFSRFLLELSTEFLKEFDGYELEKSDDVSATIIEGENKEEAIVIP